jgi:hypothetical protein
LGDFISSDWVAIVAQDIAFSGSSNSLFFEEADSNIVILFCLWDIQKWVTKT